MWILVLLIWNGPMITVKFPEKKDCERVYTQIVKQMQLKGNDIQHACVYEGDM